MSLQAFESDLISTFLRNRNKFIRFSRGLKPEHFRNEVFRWMYEVILNYSRKYKAQPTYEVIKSELMKTSLNSSDKKLYLNTIRNTFKKRTKVSTKYLEDNIRDKVDKEEFITAIEKTIRNIEKDDISIAKKELLKSLILGKADEFSIISVLRDWEKRQLVRKKLSKLSMLERFVPTPYHTMNVVTRGIQLSESATIAGLTGVGKSIMIGEFGANALLEGLNVLHFPLENTGEQTASRYDSRLSEIEYDTLKFYKFTKEEKERFQKTFRAICAKLTNDVKIQETLRNKTDFAFIDETLESLSYNGFKTDLLLIDSCDIMKSMLNFKEYRLDRASVYWDFKDYCKMKRLPGLTTTQFKVEVRSRRPTTEDLAESYDKARILDIVYLMSQTEEEVKDGIVKLILGKNRDGPTGTEINLWKDSEKMRFLEVVSYE